MSDLDNEEIAELKVIKKLLGYIEPVGETYEDKERLKNVQKYYEILCFIVSRLKEASKCKDRAEASMNKIGSECYDILQELKESLEDLEEDIIEVVEKLGIEKEKSADELFKELGYEKDEKHTRYIKYDTSPSSGIIISFNLLEKWVCADTFDEVAEWNDAYDIDMQELKAINKKCKELGWL